MGENLELLIGLASPLKQTRWEILTSLEILRDLAYMVLPPRSLEQGTLQSVVKWFGSHGTDFTPGQLLEAVLRMSPDLDTLTEPLQDHWLRFLASFFQKVLQGKTSMTDVYTIGKFVFKLQDKLTSVMKNVIRAILDATLAHNALPEDPRFPRYMHFLHHSELLSQLGEPSFEGDDHAAFVLFSDILYESLEPSSIVALLQKQEEWTDDSFFLSVRDALELVKGDGLLTVQVTAAFAFLRAVFDALATELERIFRRKASSTTFWGYTLQYIARSMSISSSLPGFAALRLYLLKVLHMKRGLSLVEISSLASDCSEVKALEHYTSILHWETMHDVSNPLGFDPFWCSSSQIYERAGEAITQMSSNQESKGAKYFDRHTDLASQRQICAVIASRLYLPLAARALSSGERVASNWILSKSNRIQKWDHKWRDAVHCFAGSTSWSDLRLTLNMPTHDLWFKTLAAHILFVVTGLPRSSPLQV